MPDGRCCFCDKILNEQVAALKENVIEILRITNPEMNIRPSNATDPLGNRRWVICLECARKCNLPGS